MVVSGMGPSEKTILLTMFNAARLFLSALAFHSWRALRGRPLYGYQTDTPVFLRITVFTCLCSSILLGFMFSFGVPGVLLGGLQMIVSMVLVRFFMSRLNTRSSLPWANGYAAMTAYNCIEVFFWVTIDLVSLREDVMIVGVLLPLLTGLGRCLSLQRIRLSFESMPNEVRASGYKPFLNGGNEK